MTRRCGNTHRTGTDLQVLLVLDVLEPDPVLHLELEILRYPVEQPGNVIYRDFSRLLAMW